MTICPTVREQLIYELSPAGEALGLSITDIGRQLRAAYDGIILQRFQQGADEVEVRLQLPESEQRRLDSLLHLPIMLPNGAVRRTGNRRQLAFSTGV